MRRSKQLFGIGTVPAREACPERIELIGGFGRFDTNGTATCTGISPPYSLLRELRWGLGSRSFTWAASRSRNRFDEVLDLVARNRKAGNCCKATSGCELRQSGWFNLALASRRSILLLDQLTDARQCPTSKTSYVAKQTCACADYPRCA